MLRDIMSHGNGGYWESLNHRQEGVYSARTSRRLAMARLHLSSRAWML
jgi:hypothetical protein